MRLSVNMFSVPLQDPSAACNANLLKVLSRQFAGICCRYSANVVIVRTFEYPKVYPKAGTLVNVDGNVGFVSNNNFVVFSKLGCACCEYCGHCRMGLSLFCA